MHLETEKVSKLSNVRLMYSDVKMQQVKMKYLDVLKQQARYRC